MKKLNATQQFILPVAALLCFILHGFNTYAQGKIFQHDSGGTLTTGLVSYFKLEDETDYWGTNNMTNYNSVPFVSGRVNNAASFDGIDQMLANVSPTGLPSGTTPLSVSFWFKTDDFTGSYVAWGQLADGVHFEVYSYNSTSITVDLSSHTCTSTVSMDTGTWYHVVVTYPGSGYDFTIYLNTVGATVSNTAIPDIGAGFPLAIGENYGCGSSCYNNGLVDELGIWNRVLTQQEIDDLYNDGNGQTMVPAAPPTPVTLNWNNSNVQEITLSDNRSFTLTNGQSGGIYTLLVNQDSTGGHYVTWPSNVKWPGGITPSLTTRANAVDMVKFVYNGINYLANGVALDIK